MLTKQQQMQIQQHQTEQSKALHNAAAQEEEEEGTRGFDWLGILHAHRHNQDNNTAQGENETGGSEKEKKTPCTKTVVFFLWDTRRCRFFLSILPLLLRLALLRVIAFHLPVFVSLCTSHHDESMKQPFLHGVLVG